jgi:hypothetical protein
VNHAAEPPRERWVKRAAVGDDREVAHLLNLLSGSVLVYASVTRGGMAVARVRARGTRQPPHRATAAART